ncbi:MULTISPECIES: competence/damage-inducible protein A [unclassified Modestobacter]|uniref:competence/damage-inducible protein A n=1 Tax=unclassified Modestobacter TaxID=2643866 RepID=UPI0022AB0AA3|nr:MULTISPECIES: competence/damage-inducible protein A [unclassified Modestobacter]MCZ2822939.1 competence/damage-inducible protein A [Modestobacter sp. VKM Ac-2981]MCZ2851185.1 competence/damage-inducible protein A [Modestobacter sp. VKM Ac-2982]
MAARAGILVTGTEVLTGRVADRNGPWLAEALRVLGVDVAAVVVVGDRPEDLRAALAFLADAGTDLVITTGGLGPTADDLTAALVGDFQGRPSTVDPALEQRIADVVARLSARRGWRMDPAATAAGVAKQAQVPAGATVLEPVGTAPGLVVPVADGRAGPPVLVLPGPPSELQGMWPAALAAEPVRRALAGATALHQSTLRLWGTPESELAATLRRVEDQVTGLEITTCLRDGELEIVTRYAPDAETAYQRLVQALTADFGDTLFSDGPTVDELVAAALDERGWTVGIGESCTGGLLTARLTAPSGSSARVLGGVAAYADSAKTQLLDVPAGTLTSVGAVSQEVAAALAAGARSRFGADVGVGVTGIAGPGGGTVEKPVGTVHLSVAGPDGALARSLTLFGSREAVRQRTTTLALHLLRQLLLGGPPA